MTNFKEIFLESKEDARHVLGLSGGKDSAALAIYIRDHYPDIHTKLDLSKLNLLKQNLTSAQEMVSMKLDTTRNELLKTNMILSIVALYLTLGGFVAGIFGMNLDNTVHLQNTPHVFMTVTLVTTGMIIVGIVLTIAFFIMYDILPR